MIEIADAARNNAALCDAVCSAHGNRGEWSSGYWLTRSATPPYYPNLVTFDPACEKAMTGVAELERDRPSPAWGLKDSFAVLSLEREGFRLLFQAEWITRPSLPSDRPSRAGTYLRIESESARTGPPDLPGLADWENAWGEGDGQERIFLPALLQRSEIAFLAIVDGAGGIRAGAIANQSDSAVGFSNFFCVGEEVVAARQDLRAECIEAAMHTFPGLPLVGYEAGHDLVESHALGFHSLGALRVWLRAD